MPGGVQGNNQHGEEQNGPVREMLDSRYLRGLGGASDDNNVLRSNQLSQRLAGCAVPRLGRAGSRTQVVRDSSWQQVSGKIRFSRRDPGHHPQGIHVAYPWNPDVLSPAVRARLTEVAGGFQDR